MSLPSKAHVSIGGVQYLLAEDQDDHYVHDMDGIQAPKLDISGDPGKQQVRPEKLLWALTDWSGGEGNRLWFSDDPTVYNYSDDSDTSSSSESGGALNGRIRGQLTGRPARGRVQKTVTDGKKIPFLALGQGALWLAGSEEVFYSTDGTSWTGKTAGLSSKVVSALAGSDDAVYYAWGDGTNRGVKTLTQGGSQSDVIASNANANRFRGLAMLHGRLYAWTGRKLFELDVFDSLPLTLDANPGYRKVHDTGTNELSDGAYNSGSAGGWDANICVGEQAVYYFVASGGMTRVYEFKSGRARPIWTLPYGFYGRSIAVQLGVLYIAGHFGGDGADNGRGSLYALPLDSLRPVFVGWFRKQTNTTRHMQQMCQSYGNQILVAAAATGNIWVYDADMDSISMLDDLPFDAPADQSLGAMATYLGKRVVAVYDRTATSSATYTMYSYDDDEPENRESTSATHDISEPLIEGQWDYGYPQEIKGLIGFHVTFKVEDTLTTSGLKAGQSIVIAYALDDESYTSLTAITSSTAISGAQGRVFIPVSTTSTTKKFGRMSVRITLKAARTASTNYQTPILYGATVESQLLAYARTWDLKVRTRDENNRTRPSTRRWNAEQARDNLKALVTNKNLVAFIDGYDSKQEGETTTYTVIVERFRESINRHAEGTGYVRLREVPA